MKKIVSLFLALSMLLCFIPASAATETKKIDEVLSFLKSIEVLGEDYDEYTLEDKSVTRGEFATFAADIFAKDGYADGLYFHDISKGHWAYEAVSKLVSANLISTGEDRYFRPDDVMTRVEAVRVFLKALGYGQYIETVTDAEVDRLANSVNIYDGVSAKTDLYMYDLLKMLYNTMLSHPLEMDTLKLDGDLKLTTSEKTYIEENFSYYYKKGVLQGYDGISIVSKEIIEGQALIDGVVFECPKLVLTDMLGLTVKYLYHYDEASDKYTLLYVCDAGKNEELELNYADNEVTFDSQSYKLSYKDENEKKKAVSISKGVRLVYNGEFVSENIEQILMQEFYTMRLIRSNGKEYDTIIMRAYTNYLVNGVDSVNEGIYDRLTGGYIEMRKADRKIYLSDKGEKRSFSDIKNGSVVSVYASVSGKRIEAVISTDTVSAKILEMTTSDNGYVFITADEEQYRMAKKNVSPNVSVGDSVTLYKDACGYIAYVQCMSNLKSVGYLIRVMCDYDKQVMSVKLFDESGEMRWLDCSDRIKIDGIRYVGYETAYHAVGAENTNPQLIAYTTDSNGRIKTIETAKTQFSSEGEFYRRNTAATYAYRSSRKLGDKMYLDDSTVIFSIPSDPKNAEEDDFYIKKVTNLKADTRYYADSYAFSDEIGCEDYVVIYGAAWNAAANNKPGIVVKKVIKTLNSDDEVVDCIIGYEAGAEIKRLCTKKVVCADLDIVPGTYVITTENAAGEIDSTNVVYTPGKHSARPKSADLYNGVLFSSGYVNDIKEKIVRIGLDSGADFDTAVNFGVGTTVVYDAANDEMYVGSVDDLISYKMSALKNSFCVLHLSYGVPVVLVVYK